MGGWIRRALFACLLLAACSHDKPPPPPAAVASSSATTAPAPPPALRVEQQLGAATDAISATLYRYNWPESHGRLWVARIVPDKARFALVPAPRPQPLATIVKGREPSGDSVAINGGFYDQDRPMGLVVAGGKPVAPLEKRGGSGVFLVEAGRPAIVHRDAYAAREPSLAIQSIDRLVDHGRVLVKPRPGLPRDARSVVAIDADGAVLFVVAFDERAAFPTSKDVIQMSPASTTTGPTLLEIAELLATDLHACLRAEPGRRLLHGDAPARGRRTPRGDRAPRDDQRPFRVYTIFA